VWVVLERAYIYGGKDVVHANTLTATTSTTETLINNMDSGSMDLLPNTRYLIRARWQATSSVVGTYSAPAAFTLRIRDTNVSGSIRAIAREEFPLAAGVLYYGELTAIYETTAGETGKVWVFSAQRVGGTGVLTFSGAGASVRLGMEVINLGHSGQLTQVTT
jgi:hypothetical protein